MSRTTDHFIDHMNREGPLSMSEADLAALEEWHRGMVSGCNRIREHLCNCHHSDQKTLDAFDDLLKYMGLHDDVVGPEPITQPQAEMAVHEGE